jgi:predicted nucleotide-binding protein (sugar kinase/HSP70/actin superfamily)
LQPFLPFNNVKRLISRLSDELKDFKINRQKLRRAVLKARAALNLFKKNIRKKGRAYCK